MKRSLVTGATGFVGANLVRRLLRAGHETHLIVRPAHQSWRLDGIRADVRLHEADLANRESVRRIVNSVKPDFVFHLAAYGAYPQQTGIGRMTETNLLGTAALVDACAKAGVEAFVQTGSSSEYGYKDGAASEDDVLAPNSHYAITKAAATHYCQFTARARDLHAVTLRLYSIYGPYEEPSRLIPTLILRGLEGRLPPLVAPDTARDFVYVDDAVQAMLDIASRTSLPRGSVYNVCSGRQSTLREVVSIMRGILNIGEEPVWSTMERRSWDTNVWVGSPARIEHETGWRAATSIEDGFRRTVRWFLDHPEMQNFYARRQENP